MPFATGRDAARIFYEVRGEGRLRAPVVLVQGLGLSMIAQHVALRHAPRVSGLVLMATSPGLPHARFPKWKSLATLVTLPIAGRVRPPTHVGRSLARLLLPEKHVPRARELLSQWPAAMRAEPPNARAFFAQLAAVATHAPSHRLRRIACPTIVMTGEDDVLIPPQNSRALARLVPNARREVVPDCGHAIPAMDPECVERALGALGA